MVPKRRYAAHNCTRIRMKRSKNLKDHSTLKLDLNLAPADFTVVLISP